jgi:(R,R)-butanediol dehydrogenase/meso-butanediol dehydrogenase/diacetyl reductase
VQASDEVVVEVLAATICASDVAEWRDGPHVIPTARPHRLTGQTAPIVLGHEFTGRVVELGDAVSSLQPGTRVCADACIRCGTCYWCRRGEYNICANGGSIGLHLDGAFARFVRVPSYTLNPLPETVSDRDGAVVEPLAVGLHALRRVRMQAGDSVVVVGLGMIGASALLMARALGARQVIVVEPNAVRASLALRLGADVALDPAATDVRRQVLALTGGTGSDVVIDCTGHGPALQTAVELARRGGRIGVCGIPHQPSELRTERLVYFEREVIGCLGYRYDHETVIALIASGKLPLDALFGEAIALEDIVRNGFVRMVEDPDAPLRIPLVPEGIDVSL